MGKHPDLFTRQRADGLTEIVCRHCDATIMADDLFTVKKHFARCPLVTAHLKAENEKLQRFQIRLSSYQHPNTVAA